MEVLLAGMEVEGIAADLSSGTDSKNSSLSSSLKKSEPAIVFDDFFFVYRGGGGGNVGMGVEGIAAAGLSSGMDRKNLSSSS